MRKDDLVHLHALLALVREEFERRGDAPPGTFEAYDDCDVSPMAVSGSKIDHERAVRTLARALAAAAASEDAGDCDVRVPSGYSDRGRRCD